MRVTLNTPGKRYQQSKDIPPSSEFVPSYLLSHRPIIKVKSQYDNTAHVRPDKEKND